VCSRVVLDPEIGSILGHVVEPDDRIKLQQSRYGVEVDQSDAIAESIVDPPDLGRCRNNLQPTIEQSLIETVAGTKYELVDTRPDRIFITIGRAVMD